MQYELADLIEAFECNFRARVNRLSACNRVSITPFQAKVLLLVEKNKDCSQQVIADCLFRDKAQVARTVKELEELDLIYRKPIKTGGRILQLSLTVEGEYVCEKINMFRRTTMEEILCSVSCEDQDRLKFLLSKLVENILDNSPLHEQARHHRHELETS